MVSLQDSASQLFLPQVQLFQVGTSLHPLQPQLPLQPLLFGAHQHLWHPILGPQQALWGTLSRAIFFQLLLCLPSPLLCSPLFWSLLLKHTHTPQCVNNVEEFHHFHPEASLRMPLEEKDLGVGARCVFGQEKGETGWGGTWGQEEEKNGKSRTNKRIQSKIQQSEKVTILEADMRIILE